jgi:hypothetical protein
MSKFNKILNYFSSEVIKKKIWVNFQRIIELVKALQNMVLGSGIWEPEQTHSGSRIQVSKRHRIPDPGSGSATLVDSDCFFLLRKCRYHSGS